MYVCEEGDGVVFLIKGQFVNLLLQKLFSPFGYPLFQFCEKKCDVNDNLFPT